jgi:hypothetical protein
MIDKLPRQSPTGDSPLPGATPSPRSPGSVFRSPATTLVSVSARLSPRDLTLAYLLDAHRVLTTEQITAMLFGSPRTCVNRLRLLRRLGFLERFRPPHRDTTSTWYWIPGPLAARYVALARDERPPSPKMLGQRQDATMASPQLAHLVGANQFFTDLIAHSRTHPEGRLTRWWSAPVTAAALSRRIHPDGHGVWTSPGGEVGWFLEHDTGTETHRRLIGKLDAYRRLLDEGGAGYPVLFWLPSKARETFLHRHLTVAVRGDLVVATAARDGLDGHSPAGPVWRLAGNGRHRLHLADLPSHHGKPGPYTPGPPIPDQDPLHLLTDHG